MLSKYYSLDECFEQDRIFDRLDELSDDSKIEYEIVEEDLIKIKDTGLSMKEKKDLVKLFEENDVIEYDDFDEEEDEEEDEEFEDDENEEEDY